jgi:glutamate carboxypeptidase
MSPDFQTIFSDRLPAMVEMLSEFVSIESPTTVKPAVDRLGERIGQALTSLGADLVIHQRAEVGDIIEARWHIDQPGKPLVILCHMDTVHPLGGLERNPLRLDAGRLYGPGAADMKGSIVTVINAIEALRDEGLFPERPIKVLMTSDEETGSFHSRELIQQVAADAALVMVMEAALPDGSLKTWRKSVARFTVRATGAASHAGGAHELGINAIEEIAHQILALQAMTDYEVGTTVSVGIVEGGTRTNVVPEVCEVQVDARAMTMEEMERLTQRIEALQPVLPGAQIEVEGGFDRPPMERDAQMAATFARASEIAARYGLHLTESGTGGGSDGNYTAAIGTPTLDGLGPLGDGAHSDREYLDVATMISSATLVAALIRDWPRDA